MNNFAANIQHTATDHVFQQITHFINSEPSNNSKISDKKSEPPN